MMFTSGITQNQVDLGRQLLDACKTGNTEEVKQLMQSGAAFTTDWMGTSPLHFAAQFGHVDVLDVLLKAGVSRDTRTKVDRTPLHLAAQEGHLEIVDQLVQHGADMDAKDLLKMTPLHWAVQRGYYDIVEVLLGNGADPNSTSKFDKTPMDIAYDVGYLDMIPILERYTSSSPTKPRKESKCTQSPANSKSRPIVLPNKAIRTPKIVQKPIATVQVATTSSSVTTPAFSPHVQKLILPTKGNISLEQIRKLIIRPSNSNNTNNIAKDDPLVINVRSVELDSCKKELEETQSKMKEFKILSEDLKNQLEEKEKSLTEMTSKHSEMCEKYTKLLEEHEELRKKVDKLSSSSPSTELATVKKETRSSSNSHTPHNNQNTSSMKTRGVRVPLVKNKT